MHTFWTVNQSLTWVILPFSTLFFFPANTKNPSTPTRLKCADQLKQTKKKPGCTDTTEKAKCSTSAEHAVGTCCATCIFESIQPWNDKMTSFSTVTMKTIWVDFQSTTIVLTNIFFFFLYSSQLQTFVCALFNLMFKRLNNKFPGFTFQYSRWNVKCNKEGWSLLADLDCLQKDRHDRPFCAQTNQCSPPWSPWRPQSPIDVQPTVLVIYTEAIVAYGWHNETVQF